MTHEEFIAAYKRDIESRDRATPNWINKQARQRLNDRICFVCGNYVPENRGLAHAGPMILVHNNCACDDWVDVCERDENGRRRTRAQWRREIVETRAQIVWLCAPKPIAAELAARGDETAMLVLRKGKLVSEGIANGVSDPVITPARQAMTKPSVKISKSADQVFLLETTVSKPADFLTLSGTAMLDAMLEEPPEDRAFVVDAVLPLIVQAWAILNGYKPNQEPKWVERRQIVVGSLDASGYTLVAEAE